ncbi:hypothetical protein Hanom_Chr07g00597131 [Helianthus anomalus]
MHSGSNSDLLTRPKKPQPLENPLASRMKASTIQRALIFDSQPITALNNSFSLNLNGEIVCLIGKKNKPPNLADIHGVVCNLFDIYKPWVGFMLSWWNSHTPHHHHGSDPRV